MNVFTRSPIWLISLIAFIPASVCFQSQAAASRRFAVPESRRPASSALSAQTSENGFFTPLKEALSVLQRQFDGGDGGAASSSVAPEIDYDRPILEAKKVLTKAATTKKEDPEEVVAALENLEKLMRKKSKVDPSVATEMLQNLNGNWQLVFTTGTKESQKKLGAKINYFPIKAAQGFETNVNPMRINNGIYIGDFAIVKFFGEFEFDSVKRKLEFDFDQISVLGFKIDLPKGKAAEIGAASGLGSDNNTKLVAKNKKPFFNWISADKTIATARGGGGGLALWKRIPVDEI